MNRVSVVVPTLNRPALLLETLASLLRQTHPPCEIIVVDDGSDPPVDAVALRAKFGERVRVLRNLCSQGLAWVRNQGAEVATGRYVAHLDDDDLFAPETLEECVNLLNADPELELVFIGVEGFGRGAGHFNQVQPEGVSKVVVEGRGRQIQPGVWQFNNQLLYGLLNRVPSAFQHVVARREVWEKINLLRRRGYQLVYGLKDDRSAIELIRGPLRDSEWALYASAVCRKTALLDRRRYLARCEGQGSSSLPAMRERHIEQQLRIKVRFFQASRLLEELMPWRRAIQKNLAMAYFDTAYHYYLAGRRRMAWSYWVRSIWFDISLKNLKFVVRLMFPIKMLSKPN